MAGMAMMPIINTPVELMPLIAAMMVQPTMVAEASEPGRRSVLRRRSA